MVDTRDLKSLDESRAGSIPVRGTNNFKLTIMKEENINCNSNQDFDSWFDSLSSEEQKEHFDDIMADTQIASEKDEIWSGDEGLTW